MANPQGQVSHVKLLFQMIQVLHHLSNASRQLNDQPSKAFSKKVQELDRFIRPAMPNQGIKSKINQVNNDWAKQVAQSLKTHYETQLDFLKTTFRSFNISANDWVSNKNHAIIWARRAIGKKLSENTLQNVGQVFASLLELAPTTQNPGHPSKAKEGVKGQSAADKATRPKVRKVRGHQDVLSNFWSCNFRFVNLWFRSAEHAYQYHKALFFTARTLPTTSEMQQQLWRPRRGLLCFPNITRVGCVTGWVLWRELLTQNIKQFLISDKL